MCVSSFLWSISLVIEEFNFPILKVILIAISLSWMLQWHVKIIIRNIDFYSKMAFTTAFSHSISYFNYTNSHKQIKIKLKFKIVKFLQDTAIASRKFWSKGDITRQWSLSTFQNLMRFEKILCLFDSDWPGIHVRRELSSQVSYWDETSWVTIGLVLIYCYEAVLDALDGAILWLFNLV